VPLFFSFHKWETNGTVCLSNLSKITELVRGKTGIINQGSVIPSLMLLAITHCLFEVIRRPQRYCHVWRIAKFSYYSNVSPSIAASNCYNLISALSRIHLPIHQGLSGLLLEFKSWVINVGLLRVPCTPHFCIPPMFTCISPSHLLKYITWNCQDPLALRGNLGQMLLSCPPYDSQPIGWPWHSPISSCIFLITSHGAFLHKLTTPQPWEL
jgi:hypothetical protein